MRKLFTLLFFGLAAFTLSMQAQDYDESFVFTDADGNVIENESVVVRNQVEINQEGLEVINSGVYVKNMVGSSDNIKVYYEIERLDNGFYQICFPSTCQMQYEEGGYQTAIGQLMGSFQDIQSEWFPEEDGECIVNLTMELYTKGGGFPPTYEHKAWGPSITLHFIKGDVPPPGPVLGDVNGDGEVNIADINAVIGMIQSDTYTPSGDVNDDGEVNIADVNSLIDIILKN